MPGLYAQSGGVNRLPKKWIAPVSGVNRELKEIWAKDSSGANRKIFSAGPSWTTNLTFFNPSNPTYLSYSISVTGTTGWANTMYFDFNDPIYINYLTQLLTCYPQSGNGSTTYMYKYSDNSEDTTLVSAKSVKRITVFGGWVDSPSSQTINVSGTLQVHSRDYGDFYLNQKGSILS